ncbi:MAG: zinc ribbon domain-containing protein [Calditrichaeota bacterium]|nr:MAG: zinc ribbon domain-containing protein [Calditrichota bacterium]MBL1205436.1 zinc ribbon domain-containing protein [Calditrichota bacterium]NOG45265.1 zinc ribbon domain-containing protein [Calditrichota bacterium]
MPTYDYVCTSCTHEFEEFQKMSDPLLVECPECDGKLQRKIGGGAGLHFKGSGFYITDYKNKQSSGESNSKKETPKKSTEKSKPETAKSEKKV